MRQKSFYNMNQQTFYICEYNFWLQRWEWLRHLSSENELISFLASTMYRLSELGPDGHFHESDPKSQYEGRFNYTGKDLTCSFYHPMRHEVVQHLRDIMIIDNNDRIIDPRDYEKEALKEFCEPVKIYRQYNNITKKHYRRHHKQYKWRYDPVPGVRHARHPRIKRWRTVKHWHRSYRDDRIPEHAPYVRKKAMVPDPWVYEPFEHPEKSWKHNTKCRHQWEKNLHNEKKTYTARALEQDKKKEKKRIMEEALPTDKAFRGKIP